MTNSARACTLVIALLGAGPTASPLAGHVDSHGDPAVRRASGAARKEVRPADALRRYLETADSIPEAADWLLLRAAALSGDSLERVALYTRIQTPAARDRILATEARARETAGDLVGAIARYDSLGQLSDAVRLQLHLAWTGVQRAALRGGLLAVIRERPYWPESIRSLEFLGQISVALTPQEALDAARLATRSRVPAAAVALYARAVRARLGNSTDLLAYGEALAAVRRHRDAIQIFTRLRSDTLVARPAAFGEALSQTRMGRVARALPTLERLLAGAPDDTLLRPKALYLAGDLAWQRGDRLEAWKRWNELVSRFPKADSATRAGFLTGLTLYEEGRTTEAARQWERIHLLDGRGDGLAAGYWAGRAWDESGDPRRASGLWQSVIARDSSSYYALLSARRLNVGIWRPEPALEQFAEYPDVDSTMVRVRALRQLRMDEEVGYEVSWLTGPGGGSAERLLAIADAFRRAGEPAAAVAAARFALRRGAAHDTRTYRLLFPREFEDDLESHASDVGLDPLLVAALIRQESSWESRARSRVGAVGLMQVMPRTGRFIARALRVRGWHPDQLLEPATNLRFGTWYLAQSLRRYDGDLTRALAAYNAGSSRIGLWATGPAAADSELFVERIGLRETRDYVRIIQRNLVFYRMLYGAPPGGV
jgi:soluble lytic murein transglycosylase-like protein